MLAIPYIYLTYFEILHIPVRNLIWFVYMLAGAVLYIVAVALAGIDRTKMSLVVAGAVGGILALLAALTLNRSSAGYFAPLIAAYVLTFVYGFGATPGAPGTCRSSDRQAIVALLALVALWPDRAPLERSDQVTVRWTTGLSDERRVALEQAFSLKQPERKTDAGETRTAGTTA